ncbi:hypothetical protein B5807_03535 [Epicoccum nigrum]|uniref:Cytochrome c oxidase polypeptide VIIA n=1 Tax=Epicoccum nigrum TaxID=105696 RepID=A0A1Y2M655_EPING|nr:hypothetical protein B5807_03535 [Epicoccum nigrum]
MAAFGSQFPKMHRPPAAKDGGNQNDLSQLPQLTPRRKTLHSPQTEFAMAFKPITGMLRRQIVLDLSVATGLGVAAGYGWWYGYHVPAVRHRDAFYQKLEDERAAAIGK